MAQELKEVRQANPYGAIESTVDRDIGIAEGTEAMKLVTDPIIGTTQILTDTLRTHNVLSQFGEQLADSQWLEKDKSGKFTYEPKTKFGAKLQEKVSKLAGPSTQSEMDRITDETYTSITDDMNIIMSDLQDELKEMAIEADITGNIDIVFDYIGEIGIEKLDKEGFRISGQGFIDYVKEKQKEGKYADFLPQGLPKDAVDPVIPTEEPEEISSLHNIDVDYTDEDSANTTNYFQNIYSGDATLATREVDRILNTKGINTNYTLHIGDLSEFKNDETIQRVIQDGVVGLYSRISGGKQLSKLTLDRINKGMIS